MRRPDGRSRPTASAILALAVVSALVGGCPTEPSQSWTAELETLKEESAAKSREIVALQAQLGAQAEQIRRLTALPDGKRAEAIPRVERIELATLSGGFDEQDDGVDEGIVIYLRPIDQDGDPIKAAGTVTVRLIDLANPPPEQEVGSVSLGVKELRACWYGRISSHYTIKLPWGGGATRARHTPITAVVSFTEYLTGRTFGTQAAFEVSGVGSPTSEPQPPETGS